MNKTRIDIYRFTYLKPERRALTHCRELRGLEVREAERRQAFVLFCKGGEASNDDRELFDEQGEGFADEDEVRVAGLLSIAR
jgi:hypothetical protein